METAIAAPVITASPLLRTYTLEEFWELPEPAERSKMELIAGVLYMTPPPTEEHDDVSANLVAILRDHIKEAGLKGKLFPPRAAIWTSPGTYLEPDFLYVSPELKATFKGHRTSADLAIEILSPGSRVYDRSAKADTYGALGVKELWLIDRDRRSVEIRYNSGQRFDRTQTFEGEELIQSAVFPTLQLRVAELFD